MLNIGSTTQDIERLTHSPQTKPITHLEGEHSKAMDEKQGSFTRDKPEDTFTYEIPDNSVLMRLFRQNHPRLYAFLSRLQRANPDCKYFQLERNLLC